MSAKWGDKTLRKGGSNAAVLRVNLRRAALHAGRSGMSGYDEIARTYDPLRVEAAKRVADRAQLPPDGSGSPSFDECAEALAALRMHSDLLEGLLSEGAAGIIGLRRALLRAGKETP